MDILVSMKTAPYFYIIAISVILLLSSFIIDKEGDIGLIKFLRFTQDTTLISNRAIGTGGKIMTDQDALVAVVPSGQKLSGISMYYSSISTVTSDSSRLFVKSQRSWSCAPLGNANPLQSDQYTLGITKNLKAQLGWNNYVFEQPVEINVDTIYVWPDLIQQIQPRVVYAQGNNAHLGNLSGTLCATLGSDISVLDYASELVLVADISCPPILIVTDSDSTCYAGDTLLARTQINISDSIVYLSKDQVVLDTTFSVDSSALLMIDMTGCL